MQNWLLQAFGLLLVAGIVLILANNYINSGGKTFFAIGGAPSGSLGSVAVAGAQVGYTNYNATAAKGCAQTPSVAMSVLSPNLLVAPVSGPNGQLVYPLALQGSITVTGYAQYPAPSTTPTLTSISTTAGANSISGLSLGTGYLFTAGTNAAANNLQNSTKVNPGCNPNVPANIISLTYTAPNVFVANTIQQSATANTLYRGAGSGAKQITFQVFLQAGTQFSSEGPILVSFADNSLAFPVCPNTGFPLYSGPAPPMTFLTTNSGSTSTFDGFGVQNQQCNYLFPSTWAGLYSNPTGGLYSTPTASQAGGAFQVTLQSSATFGANEMVSIMATPASCNFNTVNGTEVCGIYKNQVTGGTVVTPVGFNIAGGAANVLIDTV